MARVAEHLGAVCFVGAGEVETHLLAVRVVDGVLGFRDESAAVRIVFC